MVSYSLGDAIDWKQSLPCWQQLEAAYLLLARGRDRLETHICVACIVELPRDPLLARGRDRLETPENLAMLHTQHCLLLARGCDRLEMPCSTNKVF